MFDQYHLLYFIINYVVIFVQLEGMVERDEYGRFYCKIANFVELWRLSSVFP